MMLHAKSSILLAVLAATASPVFGQNDLVLRGRDSDRELSPRERSVDGVQMRTHASRMAKNDHRIVGGEQSTPGDFPYFVAMGGCGGALIAPDIVLFAAHCGDYKNLQVNVGSYKKYTTAHNSQPRFCDKWVGDPLYNGNTFDYDFALCKLDSPVYVDQSFVKLELNTDNNFPLAKSDLIVMGQGLKSEASFDVPYDDRDHVTLRNVTVPSLSNTQCKQYYGSAITDNMICAGFPDVGGKDSCQGDSGGPIIQRQYMNDGTFLDYHVGVVSWGLGCARPGYPGVYARTSKRIDWIQSTACGLGSIASFCPNPPPSSSCNTGQELTVEVTTDSYSREENFWQLTQNNNIVMERFFLVRYYNSIQKVCLEPDTCYNWKITDLEGDGINGDGSYKLTLNNQVVDSGAGNTIGFGKTVEVCNGNGTPTPPTDPPTFAPPTLAPIQNPGSCGGNTKVQFRVELQTDNYGGDVDWQLKNRTTWEILLYGTNYGNNIKYILPSATEFYCLEESQCYAFNVYDLYGDGLSDGSTGYIKAILDGEVIKTFEGNYGGSVSYYFCIDPTTFAPVSDPPTFAPVSDPPTFAPVSDPPTFAPVSEPPTFAPVQNPDIGSCGGNTKVQFRVELQTDNYGGDVDWQLKNRTTWEILLYGTNYGNNIKYILPSATEFYCLEESQCYTFEVYDLYGDGLSDGSTGYIKAILDGEVIKTFEGNYGGTVSYYFCIDASDAVPTPSPIDDANTDFPTPSPDSCEDDPDFRFKNKKKKSCEWLSKKKKKKIKKFCKKKHKNGGEKGKVFDFCAKTCGEIGLGECAKKKGKKVTTSI